MRSLCDKFNNFSFPNQFHSSKSILIYIKSNEFLLDQVEMLKNMMILHTHAHTYTH